MKSIITFIILMTVTVFNNSLAKDNWFLFDSLNSKMEVNQVGNVIVDKNDNVWFSVAGFDSSDTFKANLYKYKSGKFTEFNPMNSLQGSVNNITDILIDSNGDPWICNQIFSIAKFSNNNWVQFKFDSLQNDYIALNMILRIEADKNNTTIWVGSFNGLYTLDLDMKLKSNIYKYPLKRNWALSIKSMLIDNKNNIWFSAVDESLFKTTGTEYIRYDYDSISQFIGSTLRNLVIDSIGNIWFNSLIVFAQGSYLGKFNGTSYEIIETNITKLNSNNLFPLGVDRYNNIWFSFSIFDKLTMKFAPAGLVHKAGDKWILYDTTNSDIPTNSCNSISFDKYDNKWIGTDIGLLVFNEREEGVILSIDDDNNVFPSDITILPNPASDFIEITLGANGGLTDEIGIYEVFGRKVTTPALRATPPYEGGEKVSIDVSGLSAGMYFVRIGAEVRKFVKL